MSSVDDDDELITICPYCYERRAEHDGRGCCGESHCHYVKVSLKAYERGDDPLKFHEEF